MSGSEAKEWACSSLPYAKCLVQYTEEMCPQYLLKEKKVGREGGRKVEAGASVGDWECR